MEELGGITAGMDLILTMPGVVTDTLIIGIIMIIITDGEDGITTIQQ